MAAFNASSTRARSRWGCIDQPTTSVYDRNGNLSLENAGGALTSYVWDGENRLTRVDNPDGTNEQYTYASDGLRRKAVTAAATTVAVWDEQNVCMETTEGGNLVARYTDLPGMWGNKLAQRRGAVSRFYLPDFQGNTRNLSTDTGTVPVIAVFDAWGQELSVTSGGQPFPFRAFGQWGYYRDTAERLYVRARVLDSEDGRWLSRDPIGYAGGDWNLYGYVKRQCHTCPK